MEYMEYIKTELLTLIPVLYFLGAGIKKSKLPDEWIPLTLGVAGVLLTTIWVIATSEIGTFKEFANALFTSITQGILVAGASVYIKQLIIQSQKSTN